MSEFTIWTYEDAVQFLLDGFGELAEDTRCHRLTRLAIQNVYRDLPNRRRWSYYNRRAILRTSPALSGTVAYDHEGGANPRQLTFTGLTLPADAIYYTVLLTDVWYSIEERVSDTVATLAADSNPGADLAAGTPVTVFRYAYPLPVDFRKLGRIYDTEQEYEITILHDDAQHAESVWYYRTPDVPWRAALRATGEYYGQMELLFSPPPKQIRQYDLLYEAAARPIKYEQYTDGSLTADGTTTLTGKGGASFSADMIGAIVRLSRNAQSLPVSPVGGLRGNVNTYLHQRAIVDVPSATTLTVDAQVPAITDVRYTISDPLDIEPGAMFTAFQRMCEAELAHLTAHDRRAEAQVMARQALIEAMEADQRDTYAHGGPLVHDYFKGGTITQE
jgi:hypothetical protein